MKKGKGEQQKHKKYSQVTQRNKGSLKTTDTIFVEKLERSFQLKINNIHCKI